VGIYGTIMPAFAEQYQLLTYFSMSPAIDDGYGPITLASSFYGVLRLYSAPPTAEGAKIRMAEGNLVEQMAPFLWTETQLTLGKFISDQILISGGTIVASATNIYRLMTLNDFNSVDSLYIYGLNKLVGTNGLAASSLNFDFGTGSFL